MTRPDHLQAVIALVRRSRLVEAARLDGFLELLGHTGMAASPPGGDDGCRLTPGGVLCLMVEEGLLTRYQADELAAGRTAFRLGSYRLLERIGRGGMGEVFLAEHTLLRKRVAVKVLSAGARADAAARERFVREARAAAAVDHPNIVRVYDVDAAHDPPFLVMEYVDGVSLQAAVARHGTFTPGEAAAVGVQVARGLQQAAAVGLVHRDIKPANLLVDRRAGVKILDLGIARFETDPISQKFNAAVVLGTLDYLAPEQAVDSSRVDTRADLYALGATLYFLLAAHPPFPETDVGRKLALKQSATPPPVRGLRPDVPDGLCAVIARLLARRPDGRPQSPREAAAALQPWAAPGPDFPARFFRPTPPAAEGGPPTEPGQDRDPTPPPPTRRMIRPAAHRPDPAPPPLPPPDLPPAVPTLAAPPAAPVADNTDADGCPTERVNAPCPLRRVASVATWRRAAVVAGAVVAAALALAVCR